MATIVKGTETAVTLAHGVAQDIDLYLPIGAGGLRPFTDGGIMLVVKTEDDATAGATTSLAMTATPIITPSNATAVVPTAGLLTPVSVTQTLETALDWADGASYIYDVRFIADGLPFFGVRVNATYSGGVGDTMLATFNLVVE